MADEPKARLTNALRLCLSLLERREDAFFTVEELTSVSKVREMCAKILTSPWREDVRTFD